MYKKIANKLIKIIIITFVVFSFINIFQIYVDAKPKRNKAEVEYLTNLIQEQVELGANISTDINDYNVYLWDEKTGHLNAIKWNSCNLQGSIDLSGFTKLMRFECNHNNINKLDVSKLKQLKYLYCAGNKLKKLDVSSSKKLIKLDCRRNYIRKIKFGKIRNLTYLNCYYNNLKELKVKNFDKIDCSDNELETINFGEKPFIIDELICTNNKFEKLNITYVTNPESIICDPGVELVSNYQKKYIN